MRKCETNKQTMKTLPITRNYLNKLLIKSNSSKVLILTPNQTLIIKTAINNKNNNQMRVNSRRASNLKASRIQAQSQMSNLKMTPNKIILIKLAMPNKITIAANKIRATQIQIQKANKMNQAKPIPTNLKIKKAMKVT